ncbi:sensor histidine kinase [Demequina capsici]|uniref:histidine kinase n=1 Tax=Demequina capsici TaxID=3075620 RepID=A0AA96F4Y8_9MICO|nr:HAMP domain-containing sensor histidine kinase [Demequina sp. OYTSA14]WNM23902.1 HAMP domain-containing sensor histidine kinase [Demequina sp. OYTSA14]
MRARSISGHLSVTLVALTLVAACMGGAWSYRATFTNAKSLQDDVLTQVATLAASAAGSGASLTTDSTAAGDAATDIDISTLAQAGLPPSTASGILTATVDGVQERIAIARFGDGPAMVALQPVAARTDIARSAATSAIVPFLILIPLLLVALTLATRRALSPVRMLADELAHSEDADLTALDAASAPRELQGFLRALNAQRERVVATVAHERLFIMQAAHELRLPLTAVSLQLERAALAPDDAQLRARLDDLGSGVARSRHVVEQLLSLAHAQSEPDGAPRYEPFSTVLRSVLSDMLVAADRAGVELEVVSGADDHTPVPETAATSAMRNAIDNAIKHGGDAGRIIVTATTERDALVVTVDDGGPGIPDLDRAVRPFARGPRSDADGSGLGLAIIVEQMHRVAGDVSITATRLFPTGTSVRLSFPIALAGEPSHGTVTVTDGDRADSRVPRTDR